VLYGGNQAIDYGYFATAATMTRYQQGENQKTLIKT